MGATILAIDYYLPEKVLSTEDLAREFPSWSAAKIAGKTGIHTRHIAGEDECASDLAEQAARKLFARGVVRPEEIDYLLLCTQSPDYFLPTTACLLQDRLGLPVHCGALDFNLGHSGFVYGLGLAKGLIESGQANRVLLLTADTYSKFIHPGDKSVRTIFGDGAAATLIGPGDGEIGPLEYGTDGSGGKHLIVPTGGMRKPRDQASGEAHEDESGNTRSGDSLYMNGGEIFAFTLAAVPQAVGRLLRKAGKTMGDVDLFVFHQANQFILQHLREKMAIPVEDFVVEMGHCGNTVSSTIPIALAETISKGRIKGGEHILLAGFGVGLSWGTAFVKWGSAHS